MYFIYIITSPIRKQYIGKSYNPKGRFLEHFKTNSLIGKAIRKYGMDNMILDIIDQRKDEDAAYLLERRYIVEKDTIAPNGYNLDSGGRGGRELSEETRAKMKKPKSEEAKANMRKPKSKEAKANMRKPKSEAHKARLRKPKSEEGRVNIRTSNQKRKGKKKFMSEIGRANIIAANKKRRKD